MEKIQFDYFRGKEAEQYSFYRVPKVLFSAEEFKSLSCEAKVLYGLMLDRMSLSIKNRWLDEENRVYIIFTVYEIVKLMNCGTQKAVKLIKELDTSNGIGLIERKRLGLGKPNIIYVKNFMIKENSNRPLKVENDQKQEVENPELSKPQFKNNENHNLGTMKTINQELPKSQSNNTDFNKIDYSDTNHIESYQNQSESPVSPDKKDVIEKMNYYRNMIKEHIEYQYLEHEDAVELVELMVEVMMMPDDSTIRIAGVDKPVPLVKERFMKLNYSHIESVLFCLHKNTTRVGNIKAYLLTSLYNAPLTISNYYQAEINYDMFGN